MSRLVPESRFLSLLLGVLCLTGCLSCCTETTASSRVLPLLYRGEVVPDEQNTLCFVYRAHPVRTQNHESVTIMINTLQFHQWKCSWFLERSDQTIPLDSSEPISCTEGDVLGVRLSYRGPLDLRETDLENCRPRFLAVRINGAQPSPRKPNVAIVLVDAMRPDHLPGEKYPDILAPHLENMRFLGTEFTNWHSTSSSSRPAIGSIFTGLHPRAHGAIRHTTVAASLFPGVKSVAEYFREAGYRTAAFHSNAQISAPYGFNRGFDIYKGPVWDPDVIKECSRWLSSTPSPFFLYVHLIRLHAPYRPTDYFDHLYRGMTGDPEHDRYCSEITLTDQSIGEFLLTMIEWGYFDNTIFWFLSDHGEEFGEHGGRYHGYTLYEESIRTLSILVHPSVAPRESACGLITSHVDVLPTLCSFANVPILSPVQGMDLSGVVEGKGITMQDRAIFAQSYGGEDSDPLVSVRDAVIWNGWKWIAPAYGTQRELYNLMDDPGERKNLYADDHPVATQLDAKLRGFAGESDKIAEEMGRAEALAGHPASYSDKELENLRQLGYIR